MLESLGWPADASDTTPQSETEATVIATDEYGGEKCGWEPLGD